MKYATALILALTSSAAFAGNLSYVGSSTIGKFIKDANDVFKASSISIDTQPESLGGQQCVVNSTCDLGGVAGDLDSKYVDQGVKGVLFGKDAIAAIVSGDNPVKQLSSAQLKGVFTGKIKNWSELGGPNLPIKTYVVKQGSATRNVFQKIVLGGEEYKDAEVVTPDAKIVSMVAKDKSAIGQISLAFIVDNKEVKALSVDGQVASLTNAKYPIYRPLYLTTKGDAKGDAKAFIDWAISDAGQQLVKRYFVGAR